MNNDYALGCIMGALMLIAFAITINGIAIAEAIQANTAAQTCKVFQGAGDD